MITKRQAFIVGKLILVYHLTSGKDDTEISEIEFTKSGEIKNAPDDFFKTHMMDVTDIAISAF